MNIRKITSMTMLVSFILLALTSVILYITPHGRVAYWSDWRLWGLSKTQWDNLHINLGVLFLLAGILHIFYNWRPIFAYMKDRQRRVRVFTGSFTLALLLCLVVGAGTLLNVPPMSTVIHFAETIKERAAEQYGEPPYGHAELSSLRLFARRTGMDLQKAILLLRQDGIRVTSPEETIKEIAQQHNCTPKDLFDKMKPAIRTPPGDAALPDTPPPGFGRRLLIEICREYHLDLPRIMAALLNKGLDVDPNNSIREIAAANNMDPHAFFELLHQVATR